MHKIINPYNKFVWEKNNKTSKHLNKIHILQKYAIKNKHFKSVQNLKNGIFT